MIRNLKFILNLIIFFYKMDKRCWYILKNKELVEKLTAVFKLRYPPIAFFYTDNPPHEIYEPKKKSIQNWPCIIQLLNGVKSGRPLVLGKKSRNLCPGGLTYLGFQKPSEVTAKFLSVDLFDKEGNKIMEGERFVKTPEFMMLLGVF